MKIQLSEAPERGIELCRQGHWDEGIVCLKQVTNRATEGHNLPGTVYSFLGFGIALRESRIEDGLTLCRYGVEIGFFDADNFLNLARTHFLNADRTSAWQALEEGLVLDPKHQGLTAFKKKMGVRRKPVLPFLARGNPLNKALGQIRHRILTPKREMNKMLRDEEGGM